ncbi:electron transfer flavoprotein subunit alpha/FixB family protein [Alcaligenaceae bacterium]|nr:electron transfer flavoprotein subunit alpha/FixB family protein [Alcaligenaceae bacterium]
MTILVWAEHDGNALRKSALSAITAGAGLGRVTVVLLGRDPDAAAAEASRLHGVAEVLCARSAEPVAAAAERLAAALVQIVRQTSATHLFATATPLSRGVLPRTCALLDVMQITEVIRVDSNDTFGRTMYAGSALVTVRSSDPVKVATVRGIAFPGAEPGQEPCPVRDIDVDFGPAWSEILSQEAAGQGTVDLSDARIVLSGGRGLGSAEKFAMLGPLASHLGAAVGASRAAVDAGYASPDQQVGQTGKIVAPDLYIAVGISGAIQHLAGMKDSRVIVAINNDADAPIFQVADYGIVGDLFTVLPELEKALQEA